MTQLHHCFNVNYEFGMLQNIFDCVFQSYISNALIFVYCIEMSMALKKGIHIMYEIV